MCYAKDFYVNMLNYYKYTATLMYVGAKEPKVVYYNYVFLE